MALNSKQGIIFSDMFITNKDMFVKFFASYYREKQAVLDPIINNVKKVLDKYTEKVITPAMATDFKTAWNDFEKNVLLNQGDLQLLVAYRGKQGLNATFSKIVKQADVEGAATSDGETRYGIQSGHDLIKETMDALKASDIEKFLQKHLNDFLNQLKEHITGEEAHDIHQYHEYCLITSLQNTRTHLTNKTWINAFYSSSYGRYFGGQGLGQAYDAFMNHLADKEPSIYGYLSSSGLRDNPQNFDFMTKKTVYEEEKGVLKIGNFAELLKESRNHIGWYTGGDIVIVSPETMQIVYNIQLKTTGRNVLSVFAERVESIRTFINGFIALSPEQKGERIFEFFLTSISNASQFNSLPQTEIDNLVKQGLEMKLATIKM